MTHLMQAPYRASVDARSPSHSWESKNRARLRRALGDKDIWDIDRGTVIALPSVSLGQHDLLARLGSPAVYEERLLFSLLLLRSPGVRVIYLSSERLPETLLRYYFSYLPEDAADRITFLPVFDDRPLPLARKVLDSERVLYRLEAEIQMCPSSVLLPLDVTRLECSIGDRLAVGVFGPEPRAIPLGSKTGGRRVARAAGVLVPEGIEDLASEQEVVQALAALKKRRPELRRAIVKLNEGFSGRGNAIVDLARFWDRVDDDIATTCEPEEDWPSFAAKIADDGAIVEEFLEAPGLSYPSVQMCISSAGRVEVLSTQEQVLGGTTAQTFTGCSFPAEKDYRGALHERALAIGEVLRGQGVYGFFGIDLMADPAAGRPQIYFGEINLRMGGSTAPCMLTRLLTQGDYAPDSGTLTIDGRTKCYSATDGLEVKVSMGTEPDYVMASLADAGFLYKPTIGRGVLPYGMADVENGRVSLVCLADSREQVNALQQGVVRYLGALAGRAA